jgi:hypothetical protein
VISPAKVVQEMKIARRESLAISEHRVDMKKDVSGSSMAARRILGCLDADTALKLKRLSLGLPAEAGPDEADSVAEECVAE